GKVIVKKASDGFSIEAMGRFLGVAVALCLIVVPPILAGWIVLENTLNSDQDADPCSSFNGGESIEFDDVGFLCLDYNERISATSFETAEEHFKFEPGWGGLEEYRWAQTGDVVTLCLVDSYYDEYFCENMIRVQDSLPNQNLSYYSMYGGMTQDMPSWVNDRPSSVDVEYASSTVGPFGADRLMKSIDDGSEWNQLEVRSYNANSFEISNYNTAIERGMFESILPYVLPIIIGMVILLRSGLRVPLLEFDQQHSKIQRRLNIGTPLSKFDWTGVDFQNFTLAEHSFTLTFHHSEDEHTSSSTSYTHHTGVNLSCTYDGGSHVLLFIENKEGQERRDLIDQLFKALDLESPFQPSSNFTSPGLSAQQGMILPPLVTSAPGGQAEETSSPAEETSSSEVQEEAGKAQDPGGFWDQV
ncbi:MAG: hypothetical protein L7U25_01890, partial [Candidatus Poseidonia sp.]|nr:hypothetical protein [Poseidonia sp.]